MSYAVEPRTSYTIAIEYPIEGTVERKFMGVTQYHAIDQAYSTLCSIQPDRSKYSVVGRRYSRP